MSNRKLAILAVAALVMIVWAVVQSTISNRPPRPATGPADLIQGLDTDAIASIVVATPQSRVTLRRVDKAFVVENKNDYPADIKQVNDLITKCLDIKTLELATSDPTNHKQLEVTEDTGQFVIKFLKADGTLLTGLVAGKSKEGGAGGYVRLLPGNDVFLTDSNPWFRTRAVDYVNQELTAVTRDNIQSVIVRSPDGSYTLQTKAGSNDLEVVPGTAGKKLKQTDAQSVFTALTSLRFDDVNKPADNPALNFDRTYICRLKDSSVYTLQLAKKDNKTFLHGVAEYTDPNKVTIDPKAKDSAEELKKKEAKLVAQEKVLKFNQKAADWIYQIPDWKAAYLTKKLDDLLEQEKPPVAEPNAVKEKPAAGPPTIPPATGPSSQPTAQPNSPPQPPTPAPGGAAAKPEPNTPPATR